MRILILTFCLLLNIHIFASSGNEDKAFIEFATKANNFNDLEKGLSILKKYNRIFKYIPSLNPINPKNDSKISSMYGQRFDPINKDVKAQHSGLDIACTLATTVHAAADGVVIFEGNKSGYGKVIYIQHEFGFETRYAHLSFAYIKKGKKVKKGDIIGFVGSTGKSTGNHLHYEVRKNNRPINPIDFLNL